jgi:hypothetical protein
LDEFKRFVDEKYPGCNWRHLAVQNQLVAAVGFAGVEISTEKREEIIDTTLSIIDYLSMHPDPTINQYNIERMKANNLNVIGDIRLRKEDLTEDEAKKGLRYLEDARKIRESFGDALGVLESESTIAFFRKVCIERFGAQETFGKLESLEQKIERLRNTYHMALEQLGEVASLKIGTDLASSLRRANRTIEAWRLMKRLIAIKQQYYGREHRSTKALERLLNVFHCKIQFVTLKSLDLEFEAFGYEDDKYILRGPIDVPEEEMETLRVDPADVIFLDDDGTPVVCHGLKNNAAYLNGKIGDARSFDETTGRYGVYFEDESIKPKSVKPQNLRILFELPDN